MDYLGKYCGSKYRNLRAVVNKVVHNCVRSIFYIRSCTHLEIKVKKCNN